MRSTKKNRAHQKAIHCDLSIRNLNFQLLIRVRLLRNDLASTPSVKVESGFLNSFVSFISMSTEASSSASNRPRTAEEEELAKVAAKAIKDCNVENLITESKFLPLDSLKCLVENLVRIVCIG